MQKKVTARLDLWQEPILLPTFLSDVDSSPENEAFVSSVWKKNPPEKMTSSSIVEMCRELIYNEVDGEPVIHAIMTTINAPGLVLQISHVLDILVSGTPEERSETIRNTLAFAFISDVPVYPNTEALAPVLARYTRDLFLDGFTAPNEAGQPVRLRLIDAPRHEIESIEYLRSRPAIRHLGPAEMLLLRDAALRELARHEEAARVLARIEVAIQELNACLKAKRANERAIQRCLERNPILFGTQYRAVLPKHRLGAEYEMDFALKRTDGLVDLVEIEASTHPLFTRKGDPSKYLVHAEQQALDWFEWIERNSTYARESLPGVAAPTAFVVIGRSQTLSEADVRRLRRRNLTFRERLRLLTYDDLLQASQNLLQLLRGDA